MYAQQGVPSTCAAIVVKMSSISPYASRSPPGMIDGPCSAPSSPPDTPVPMKRRPRSRHSSVRRRVSRKRELPPSITMSPSSSSGSSASITPSTGAPALTMTMIRRGLSSESTNSSSDSAAANLPSSPCSAMNSRVRSAERLCTATGTSRLAMLRARLAPITASPVTPIWLPPLTAATIPVDAARAPCTLAAVVERASASGAVGRRQRLCVRERLLEQPRERPRARVGEVEAVGLEPAAVAAAVADPVEQHDALLVVRRGLPAVHGVAAGAAAELARGDEAEDVAGTDDAERPPDVVAADREVGPERHHHEVRHCVPGAAAAQESEALLPPAAAVRVHVVAGAREVLHREQHRRVADRERRAAVLRALRGALVLDAAAARACGSRNSSDKGGTGDCRKQHVSDWPRHRVGQSAGSPGGTPPA